MSLRVRGLWCVIALFGLLTTGRSPLVDAQQTGCTALLRSFNGVEDCFLPSQIDDAERAMPSGPVRPVAVVLAASHLRLKQILVSNTEVANGGTPTAYAIHYIFGSIPTDQRGVALPTSSARQFVVVSEFVGRISRQNRTATPGLGVFASFLHSQQTGNALLWSAQVNLAGGKLSLFVVSNKSASVVNSVTDAVAKTARKRAKHLSGHVRAAIGLADGSAHLHAHLE